MEELEETADDLEKNKEKKEVEEKEKEYFGQFKPATREKVTQKFTLEDTFQSKFRSS